jgi:hypothetical protein
MTFVLVWLLRIVGQSLVNKSSATNTPSDCGIANSALNDAKILSHDANSDRMGFSERTGVVGIGTYLREHYAVAHVPNGPC